MTRFNYLQVVAILIVFSFLVIFSNMNSSPTNDEFAHLPAGYVYLKKGDFSLYHKNPPLIKMINALPLLVINPDIDFQWHWRGNDDWTPWIFAKYFMEDNKEDYDRIFFWGRMPVLLLSLCLAFFIYKWATELYGRKAGLFAIFLYSFSPNIIAHSSLATVDVGASFLIFLTLYCFRRFLLSPSIKLLFVTGIILGLAQLAKFTSIFLIIIIPICGLVYLIGRSKDNDMKFSLLIISKINVKNFSGLTLSILTIFFTGLIVLNAGYGFKGSFSPLGAYQFQSSAVQQLGAVLPDQLPVPLPYEYVAGFDDQKNDVEFGEFPNFFMGKWSDKGLWYYLPVASLIKMPIPFLLFIAAVFFFFVTGRFKRSWEEVFLIIPILLLFIIFTFLSNLDIGIRYLLPIYPFMCLLVSRLATLEFDKRSLSLPFVILILWYVYSSISIFPHYLSYFNEFVGGPKNGYKYLIDSNIDWGQDLKELKKYMDKNDIKHIKLAYFGSVDPAVYGISYEIPKGSPGKGIYAVSANYLQGLPYPIIYGKRMMNVEKGYFSWITGYDPIGYAGNSILIYKIN